MSYDNLRPRESIANLPNSVPFVGPEVLARRVGRTDLLRLGANESPFGAPAAALRAMCDETTRIAWYGDPDSLELRDRLAQRHACDPDEICVGAGIDDLMGLAVQAFLAPGAPTVTTAGTYMTYAYHIAVHDARLDTVSYRADGRIDLDALSVRARATQPRIVYLANPDNPSGTLVASSELAAFIDALPSRSLLLLDEAYIDFVDDEECFPLTIDPRIIRLRTFSKAYGMAGARIGYALADRRVIETFGKIRLHFNVNRLAQAGALAALEDDVFVREVARETAQGREEYVQLGQRVGCVTIPSRTNFVCFDIGTRARAEALVEALLERGVFIRKPGFAPLDRYVRVSVGNADERARFAHILPDALAAVERGLPR